MQFMSNSDLYSILIFYLASVLISFIGFSAGQKIFFSFPDKGYPIARVLGLLLLSFFIWIVSYVLKIPINTITVSITALIFFFASLVYLIRYPPQNIEKSLRIILFEEILFVILYLIMLIYRALNPSIETIEKFMDYAIINGLIRGDHMPPIDVWYSQSPINYYYFGHFCLVIIQKLTLIHPPVFYNLSIGLIFALSGTVTFSVVYRLSKKIIVSLFSALLLIAGGNMDLMYQTFHGRKDEYFFAEARGLIDKTINEFPSYSFLISDLHAHILDIPFVLLFIGLMLVISEYPYKLKNTYVFIISAISLGALGSINSWDFVVHTGFTLLCLIGISSILSNKSLQFKKVFGILKKYFIPFIMLPIAGVILYIFNYFIFKPAVFGVGITHTVITLTQMFRMFGYFYLVSLMYAIYLVIRWIQNKKKKESAQNDPIFSFEDKFTLILFVSALGLSVLPLIFYLKDIYSIYNPPYYLANTTFKIWYQSWIFFCLASAYGVYRFFAENIRSKTLIIAIPFGIILAVMTFFVFIYPVEGVKDLVNFQKGLICLDGSQYLLETQPNDKYLIDWINTNISDQPVLIEAYGKPYTRDSLLSSFTGLPTPIGWAEHELGWRNDWDTISAIMLDIERIYTETSPESLDDLIDKYNAKFIAVTDRERNKYGENAGLLISKEFPTAVCFEDTCLYEIP